MAAFHGSLCGWVSDRGSSKLSAVPGAALRCVTDPEVWTRFGFAVGSRAPKVGPGLPGLALWPQVPQQNHGRPTWPTNQQRMPGEKTKYDNVRLGKTSDSSWTSWLNFSPFLQTQPLRPFRPPLSSQKLACLHVKTPNAMAYPSLPVATSHLSSSDVVAASASNHIKAVSEVPLPSRQRASSQLHNLTYSAMCAVTRDMQQTATNGNLSETTENIKHFTYLPRKAVAEVSKDKGPIGKGCVEFNWFESQLMSDSSQVIWLSSDWRFEWFGCHLIWDSNDFGRQLIWDSSDLVVNWFEIQVIWMSNGLRCQKWSFETQKRSFSARLPSKIESLKLKKRSFSARRPSKFKLWSSRRKLLCETSFKKEALKIKYKKCFCETSFKNDFNTF